MIAIRTGPFREMLSPGFASGRSTSRQRPLRPEPATGADRAPSPSGTGTLFSAENDRPVLPYHDQFASGCSGLHLQRLRGGGRTAARPGASSGAEVDARRGRSVAGASPGRTGGRSILPAAPSGLTTKRAPCSLIAFGRRWLNPLGRRQKRLLTAGASSAQAGALAFRKDARRRVRRRGTPPAPFHHRVFDGNRPSTTILAESSRAS